LVRTINLPDASRGRQCAHPGMVSYQRQDRSRETPLLPAILDLRIIANPRFQAGLILENVISPEIDN
jgi:hypothetical protein